ncbi:mitochondrial 37S ribosomal protein YmS18 [Saccharomycopsis crataegensis]|uniref:Small ribosomal subunit protein uS11m n=1 Tax=Saccharomycopsis crataegensis TaxID=43959 RepID=A0AAV5QLY9_9ASCO|nr:mitochondrial 37S ribosomal protein YmS18 [Saccharomycopsis crataegensis]
MFRSWLSSQSVGVRSISQRVFSREFSTSKITQAPGNNKIVKKEKVVKNILYCNFGRNNTHLALVSVIEDLNFLKNNPELSYNDKMLYYLRLPQKLRIHLSCGNVGFRKAARGEYEAAFQTTVKMFKLIEERKLFDDLEVDLRNFGKGRAAFQAALLGKEGLKIKPLVTKLSESTKLKFGGVRSPRERRL